MLSLHWDDIEDLVDVLSAKIPEDTKYIYGLTRGGLIPAVMLSHKLNIPMITSPQELASSTIMNVTRNILIVDDIADSGFTLKAWSRYPTAVLHYKPHTSDVVPDLWAVEHKTDDWIVYPWEHPEAKNIQDYKLDK
tara:strand:- start:196 stop:603 length:408 start_codon:yes stop_codon:yes gene_type:complete